MFADITSIKKLVKIVSEAHWRFVELLANGKDLRSFVAILAGSAH